MVRHIALTGGGTGGHVFPGLALINPLTSLLMSSSPSQDSINYTWIGSYTGPEKDFMPNECAFVGIASGKLRRYFSLQNIIDPFHIIRGFFQALRILSRLKPQVLISIGGFVSVPVVYAAYFLKIPVVSIVCDISLGLATKINILHSHLVLCAYPETQQYITTHARYKKILSKKHTNADIHTIVHCVGNPVRQEVYQGDKQHCNTTWNIKKAQKVILFLGGSKGASQINELVQRMLPHFSQDITVIHQYGIGASNSNMKEHTITENSRTNPYKCQYIPVDFIAEDYAHVLARSDVIVSRAGAGALWEIVANAIPAVIIPLSTAGSRGDQIENARYFEEKQLVINLGTNPSSEILFSTINALLQDAELSDAYRQSCAQMEARQSSERATKIISKCIPLADYV